MSYIKSDDFKDDSWVKTQLLDFPFSENVPRESFRQSRSKKFPSIPPQSMTKISTEGQ